MIKIDEERIINELSEKWNSKPCQYCGGDWTVSRSIYKLSKYKENNLWIDETCFQPVIPVTCTNCGNTVLINPLVLGLIED